LQSISSRLIASSASGSTIDEGKQPIHASAAMTASCGPLANWIYPNSMDWFQAMAVAQRS
jgi:hypothetical protein